MPRNLFRLLVIVLAAVLCSACSSGTQALRTAADRNSSDIKDLRKLLAQQRTQIASLENSLRTIRGQLERLNFETETEVSSNSENLGELERKYLSLRRRVPPPALVPVPLLEEDESFAFRLQGDEQRLFQNGLIRLREANYTGAYEQLLQLRDQTAIGSLHMRVLFWLGVASEGAQNYKGAVAHYNELGKGYPEETRAADGLLRLGSVFVRLKDFDAASLMYQKIERAFPGSQQSKIAREKQRDLR